ANGSGRRFPAARGLPCSPASHCQISQPARSSWNLLLSSSVAAVPWVMLLTFLPSSPRHRGLPCSSPQRAAPGKYRRYPRQYISCRATAPLGREECTNGGKSRSRIARSRSACSQITLCQDWRSGGEGDRDGGALAG